MWVEDIKALSESIHRLNCKVLKIYREKSLEGFSGRTEEYKNKLVQNKILEFLHQNKEASNDIEDEIPSMKVFWLWDFWSFISRDIPKED